ncbi:MAG TPA: UDP-N-acetylmuramoyl-L-alanyl-D-glutamate--2,6-diaminopimelate ligase [Chlamydiales bacterium]|nr:UDP-N-acetylmuramoyl-L-alanyl-D-glutamate--2,6-diaminopimelate ligase [Chlamydiales bacterium]
MLLKRLFQNLNVEIKGKDTEITGICSDSRIVAPGNLFIAKGKGAQYITQAMSNGARAIVTDLYDPFLSVTQIIAPNPQELEARIASRYYERPSEKLFCVGVTGSKGKTTTTYLCRHLLEKLGQKCGLIGTIETWIEHRVLSNFTTHDACANQKQLREMVNHQCKAAVLEVSSHGLDQGRVDEIQFDCAIFTNLYPDHLDYHKTVEQYAAAKKKLFSMARTSILNVDSPWSTFMGNGLTVGIENPADIRAENIVFNEFGTEFTVDGVQFVTPLMGYYNVYNVLCAIGLGVIKGKRIQEMSRFFLDFESVPGRLERVPNDQGKHIIVDYAHTGESLAQTLATLKPIAKQKMIVVFGCGGNRDKARRTQMAEAAEKFADYSIITTDNPRSEDPEIISQEIKSGFRTEKYRVILDRKMAIQEAIAMAKAGDFVVIAGKGHEKVQIFSHQTVSFDDVAIAKSCV